MTRATIRCLGFTLGALALVACKPQAAPIDPQHVAEALNHKLPQPYVDGLVMQHARAEDNRLVVEVRIPFASAAQIDPKKLPLMRTQEQGDLNIAACKEPELKALMDHHFKVTRRFLDKDGKLVFQIDALKAPNCKLVGGATP